LGFGDALSSPNESSSPKGLKKLGTIEWFVTCQITVTTVLEDCAYRRFQLFAIV